MKIKLNKEEFLKKLNIASKFTSSKLTSSTSLQGILLKKEKDKLHFYSTNLNIYYHGYIKTEGNEDFQLVIEPKKTIEFLTLLPVGNIEVEIKEKTVVFIHEKTKGEFLTFSHDDFPLISNNSLEKKKIDASFLKSTLPFLFFSASSDESRPVLTGVNFVSQDESTQIVSTDGFRLSLINFKDRVPFSSVIIPSSFLMEINRLIEDEKEIYFSFKEDEKTLTFYLHDEEFTTRLIEGDYPPYEKVIPTESKTTVVLDREEFLRNVKIVSVFARDFSNIVILEVEAQGIKLIPKTGGKEDNITFQEAEVKGENQRVAFNYKFLVDFLTNIKSKTIKIELLRPDSPTVFKSEKNPNFLHIIMPIRIQD